MQFPAIRKQYIRANPNRLAVLAGVELEGNLVAGFQRRMSPAQANQITWIVQFDGPIYYLAAFILRVQIDLAMRIGPNELRNCALQGDSLGKIVPLRSVVCHDGAAKRQKTSSQGSQYEKSTLHLSPPRSGSKTRNLIAEFSDSDHRFPHRTLLVAATQRICQRDRPSLESFFPTGK